MPAVVNSINCYNDDVITFLHRGLVRENARMYLRMADPDVPPEVNPTRRDPDEPEPNIPVRLEH